MAVLKLQRANRKSVAVVPSKRTEFNALPLLTVFVGLITLIPARWVVPGLGAAGRPASLFAMGLFALWCCLQMLPNVTTRPTPWRWVLFVDIVVILITYTLGRDRGLTPAEALSSDRALLGLIASTGVILMASEGLSGRGVEMLTKRITYFAGIVAGLGLVQFIFKYDPYTWIRFPGLVLNTEISNLTARGSGNLVRVKSSTQHPIEFAVVMALALPLALHHAYHETHKVLRSRRFSLALLIAGASLLAVSRTAVIAVAAAVIMMFWAWSPTTKLRAAGASMVFLVAMRGLIPGLLGTLLALFQNINDDSSITGRTDDYGTVSDFVSGRPWFGRGVGTFIPEQYILLDNAYLGRLVATGFIGLASLTLVFLAGVVLPTIVIRRSRSDRARHLSVSLRAMVVISIVSAATFDLFFFATATGFLLIAMGCTGAVFADGPGAVGAAGVERAVPILKRSYQAGYRRRPWWHRFDPEYRELAVGDK